MVSTQLPVAATLAAHDPLGGAGIAADLTTFAALGVHGTAAVTAVTAQHLTSVDRVESISAEMVAAQLDGICDDFAPAAFKTGLIASCDVIDVVVERIDAGRLPRPVVDPVLVDGRGNQFVSTAVEWAYREQLIPRASVLTPNVGEVSVLLGREIATVDDVCRAGRELASLGAGLVVVTGGAIEGDEAVDVVIGPDGGTDCIRGPWIDTPHVRGSGCTFAAAITALLCWGVAPAEAVADAKVFVQTRLAATSWPSASGAGPIRHVADS